MAVGTQDLRFRVLAQVVGANAVDSLGNSVKSLNDKVTTLGSALKYLAGLYSAKEAIEYGRSIIDVGDQLNKLSQKSGASVEQLAKLREEATLADVPFDALTNGLKKLSVNLVDAAQGNDEVGGTLKKLGINFRDASGQIKNAGDVMEELQGAFQKLKDGPEKAAIAVKLFGKAGSELIPLLNAPQGELSKFANLMDTDFAEAAEKFNDTLRKIGFELKGNTLEGLQVLLPTLQDIADTFLELSKSRNDSIGFFELVGEAARAMADSTVKLYLYLQDLSDFIVTNFKVAGKELKFQLDEANKLGDEYDARSKKRVAQIEDAERRIFKNSLFNDKPTPSIADLRRSDDTDSSEADDKRKRANIDELGEVGKLVRETEQKLAKMRAESQAYGLNNAEKQIAIQLAELEAKHLSTTSDAYKKLRGEITQTVTANETAKEKNSAKEYLETQERAIQLQALTLEQIDETAVSYKKLVEIKTIDNQTSEATKHFTQEGAAAYRDAAEAVKKQRLALIDLEEQQKETWSTGAKQALNDYLESARDVASQTRSLFQHAFSNMEDSLVSFVKTGQLNFSKFADDLITDIIRIQVRAALAQSIVGIGSLFGGITAGAGSPTTVAGGAGDAGGVSTIGSAPVYSAKGNVMTSDGPMRLRKYAAGGIARSPQVSVFGEGSMPEAYVPLPDGRSIPVSVQGGSAGGGDINLSVHVNVESGQTSSQGDQTAQGSGLAKLVTNVVKTELINQKRPGGLLA